MKSGFSIIITSVLFTLVGISGLATEAQATKLPNTKPLPSERELKDFDNGQEFVPAVTRYQRRPDYRDEERISKERAEEARREQQENQIKARDMQSQNIKKAQQTALEHNNRGVMAGRSGHWVEAISAHESACQADPGNKQYRINLSAARTAYGQDRLNAKDFDAAGGLFRKALSAAPDNALASKMLAETMKKQGRDPGAPEDRLFAGDQLVAAGDFESAMIEYQAALQLDPSARTCSKMGDVAMHYNQLPTAESWYKQALSKDPNYGAAYRQLGLLQMARRDYTGAAASLRKAIIIDAKDQIAGQNLVDIWRRQVAANPLSAENHLGLAGALQLTGDFNGAEGEYNKLQALDANHPSLAGGKQSLQRARQHAMAEKHKLAAETLFNQGLRREALAEISQAVMMESRNSRYQFLLGECLEANGDFRGAHQAYLTAVLIDPENNKEAAYRMKEMQRGSGLHNGPTHPMQQQQAMPVVQAQPQQMPMQQAPMQMQQPMQQAPVQQAPMQAQDPGQPSPVMQQLMQQPNAPQTAQQNRQPVPFQKNMFEGGGGMESNVGHNTMRFSTHDETSGQSMQQHQSAPVAVAQPVAATPTPVAMTEPVDPATADTIARAGELETRRNYEGAAAVLREALSKNLQNAELHHRLAVDLLAAGQVSLAIAEFRIASALKPANRDYAGDLARAMAIHKRSLQPEQVGAASGKEVAAK